jgi:hypothetical protein
MLQSHLMMKMMNINLLLAIMDSLMTLVRKEIEQKNEEETKND